MSPRMLQWVRWPLWSWRNLAVTTLAVLVLFAAIGRLTSATAGPPRAADTAASASTSGTENVSVPTGTQTLTAEMPVTPSGAAASSRTDQDAEAGSGGTTEEVATKFVSVWARPDQPAMSWLAALTPLTTASFRESLSGSDPARVPASKVTGAARGQQSGSRALVTVPTDAGALEVSVVREGGQWKVADIAPADAPPGAPTPTLTGGAG